MKACPFLINQDASGQKLEHINIHERAYDEHWLQAVLRQQPDILPVAGIETVFYPLVPIGIEVITETGAIDNLFISHRGYLVLVETKLWRNPDAKREVIAQAIDYGSSLSKWNYDRLNGAAREYTKRHENTELELADWVESKFGPVEGGRYYFEDTVAKNLTLGRFLTLIVGDKIRPSVVEMLKYVNRYPHLATNIALVELNCYRWGAQKDGWPLLIVPNIVARTEIVERSIIQVTINAEGAHQIDVQQEKAPPEDKGPRRVTLTEEAFWELLKQKAPGHHESIRRLIDEYRAREGIQADPTDAGIAIRLDIQDSGEQASLFVVNKNAELWVWPETVRRQLERAGLDLALAESYRSQMRRVFSMSEKRVEFGRSFGDINLDDFKSVINDFIKNVQAAERID